MSNNSPPKEGEKLLLSKVGATGFELLNPTSAVTLGFPFGPRLFASVPAGRSPDHSRARVAGQ
jgi:hypothetical protein